MAVDVQVECTVARPVGVVAAFAGDGPFPMETTYTWVALGEHETTTKDLARFKHLLESPEGPGGAAP